MMIEGGEIDWVCHANRGWACIEQTLAMDRAVEVAYQFYLQNPENTLILITADHETGGLKVHEEKLDLPGLRRIEQQREQFDAEIPTDMEGVLKAIEDHYGITEITDPQGQRFKRAIKRGDRDTVARLAVNIAQAAAGITWSTGGHTGVDVPVYAVGAGADQFRGTYDATQIPARTFTAAVGLPLRAE